MMTEDSNFWQMKNFIFLVFGFSWFQIGWKIASGCQQTEKKLQNFK